MIDMVKAEMAMMLIALAKFNLDLCNSFLNASPWEVAARRELQEQASRLINEAKSL
ncbi:MAG TPA: hypothetical protein VK558_15755 [Patescibacteria group bacterium]|nr:hypothetical protein [Patescibacteria group bacterium]